MAKEKRKSASQARVGSHKQLTRSLPGASKPGRTSAKRRKAPRGPATAATKGR